MCPASVSPAPVPSINVFLASVSPAFVPHASTPPVPVRPAPTPHDPAPSVLAPHTKSPLPYPPAVTGQFTQPNNRSVGFTSRADSISTTSSSGDTAASVRWEPTAVSVLQFCLVNCVHCKL